MNFEWIPVKTRPKTEEEKEAYPNCECMFDCILPKDGEDILISLKFIGWNGNTYYDVDKDTALYDEEGCYLDSGHSWENVTAWMPLPEPYNDKDANSNKNK